MSFSKSLAAGAMGLVLAGTVGACSQGGAEQPIYATGFGLAAMADLMVGIRPDAAGQRMSAGAVVRAAEAKGAGDGVVWQSNRHGGTVTPISLPSAEGDSRSCRMLRQEMGPLSQGDTRFVREVKACVTGDGIWEVRDPSRDDAG